MQATQYALADISEADKRLMEESIAAIEQELMTLSEVVAADPIQGEHLSNVLLARARAVNQSIGRIKATYVANFEQMFQQAQQNASSVESAFSIGGWVRDTWSEIEDESLQDFVKPHIAGVVQQIQQQPERRAEIWAQTIEVATEDMHRWNQTHSLVQRDRTIQTVAAQMQDVLTDSERADLENKSVEELDAWASDQIEHQVDREFQLRLQTQLQSTLRQSGFSLAQVQDTGAEIRILARKPSGNRAMFILDDHGGLLHKFDQYEGHACKEDAEGVIEQLKSVYGVQFDDETKRWEAPLRISRDAKPLPTHNRRDK
jgi:acyl carrier protein phosphodiesterase